MKYTNVSVPLLKFSIKCYWLIILYFYPKDRVKCLERNRLIKIVINYEKNL